MRGNAENCINEAKYDMAVGHLLLKSFWANEAVFQMVMLSYNLFLLFKFDFLGISEFRQQIKTFRLKYMFLVAKIIRTARYVVMKLPAKYPHKKMFIKTAYLKKVVSNIAPVLAPVCLMRSVYHTQYSASQELFIKFMAMCCRKCYNKENISKTLHRLKVYGGDFILRWYSGGISFKYSSPVEKNVDNFILTWNSG